MRRKMRLIAVAGLALMLTFMLVGGAVAAKPEPAGELRWTGVVAFPGGVNFPAKQRIIDKFGGVIEKELEALDMAIVWLPTEAAARALEKEKGVLWVEKDSYRYYTQEPQPLPWGIDRIDAEEAWKAGNTGDGVNVAVLDTGIDTDHPDLRANLEDGYSAVNRDTSNVEDRNGHGTHVSGIIAAVDNTIGVVGVSPSIDLYPVQISKGARIRLTDILEGINWCIETLTDEDTTNDIQVMSMSYGGGYSQSEDDALLKAYEAGIVLISSAGNQYGGAVTYPAALWQVIAVSATDDKDQIASFSSTGSEVELAAPGVSIYSTYKNGGYETLSGTSMAGPHVAGVAALVIGTGSITNTNDEYGIADEVRAVLQTTAEDLGTTGKDNLYGYGLVDAAHAVLGSPVGDDLVVDTGSIDGTVTDADTGAVIADATVVVEGTDLWDTTDAYGHYIITEVPVGTYTVAASAEGYESQSVTDVTVTKDATTTVDFALTEAVAPTGIMSVDSISFSAKKAGPNLFLYTAVKVVLLEDGNVDGARVEMTLTYDDTGKSWSFAGDTGPDGTVEFTLLKAPSGNYTATVTLVSHADYDWDGVEATASCTLNPDGTVTVTP